MKRVAVVTGGTRGIGRAISVELKDAGYTVAASYGDNDAAANEFSRETGISVYKFDVGDFDQCSEGLGEITDSLGSVEILINNAGITRDKPLHKMEKEDWETVIQTDLTSAFNMCRLTIDAMRDKGFGRIINVSSINGQKGQFGQTNYSAAKAGLIGFTKALALETASKGITVNAVAPGYVGTEMIMAVPEKVLKEVIIPQIPMRRLGRPEGIARCVRFLADDEASFITGSTLTANGGQYMT